MRIALTKQMVEDLKAEKARSGVGSIALLRLADDVPEGLKHSVIEVMSRGGSRTVEETFYRFVMRAYRALPDAVPNRKRPVRNSDNRIAMTHAMRARLREIWSLMPSDALQGPDAPAGLTPCRIGHLLGTDSAGGRRDRTIRRDWWAFLCSYDPSQAVPAAVEPSLDAEAGGIPPDLLGEDIPPSRERGPAGRVPNYAGVAYVPIADDLYLHFHAEIRRTRVSPKRLLRARKDRPKGLTQRLVSSWLRGRVQSAEGRYLDYLHFHYGLLPDAPEE